MTLTQFIFMLVMVCVMLFVGALNYTIFMLKRNDRVYFLKLKMISDIYDDTSISGKTREKLCVLYDCEYFSHKKMLDYFWVPLSTYKKQWDEQVKYIKNLK